MNLINFIIVCGIFNLIVVLAGYFYFSRKKPDNSKDLEIAQLKGQLETLKLNTLNPTDFVNKSVYLQVLSDKEKEIQVMIEGINELRSEKARIGLELDKIKSSRKSEQVRLGQIAEQILPFLEAFKYDPKNLKPMFQPIDYVCFEEDEIIFIEVKTGNSALSQKQKKISRQIKEGKVRFEVHRINENKYEVKP